MCNSIDELHGHMHKNHLKIQMQLSYAKYFFLNFKKAYRSWAPGIVPKRWQPEGLLFGVHAFNCNQLLFLVEKKNLNVIDCVENVQMTTELLIEKTCL